MLVWILNPLAKSCSIQHRRLTASDSLEERVVMAKSSMVASTIPKSPIYHGNKDAYGVRDDIDKIFEKPYLKNG